MFGYVTADFARLTDAQRQRYHSVYCGLCRVLSAQYGVVSALALSYDLTFLTLLLNALYEPQETVGTDCCLRHVTKPQSWAKTEFTDYAAAMNCLLSYESRRDDWADEHRLHAAVSMGLLSAGAKRAAARAPQKAAALRHYLEQITRLEQDRTQYSEGPANAFGALMAELFTVREDRWQPVLARFGRSLGKLIYFMDAACDLREDRKRGCYNPLALLGVTDGARFRPQLQVLAGDAAAEFERLPIVQDAGLLQNILYSGIWTRFSAMFETQQEETV